MATKIGSLFGDVSLRTAGLQKDITKAAKMLGKFGSGMQSLGKDLTAKLTVPIVGIGVASLKTFADFEKGMNEVKSLMPNLNQGEFAQMQEDLRGLSVEMGTNVVDSTKALYQAISAGVPKENAISFLRVASQSAIAGVTDVETAVDGLTSVMNAYKMEASEAEKVSDILFSGVKLGKTTFGELSKSMFQVAPLAAAMNVPLEEVTAAVATLTKQGVPTSVAMTQIRAALVSLQKPNSDMVSALGELGVSTGQALLDSKGLQGALEALRTESGLGATELTRAFGSVEASGAVLALTGENFKGAVTDLEAVTSSAKSMFEAFKENNEGLWADLKKIGSAFREIALQIGEQFAPKVAEIAEQFKTWYADNKESIPGWIELGAKIAAVAAVVGPLLLVVGTMITTIASLVTIFVTFNPVVLGVVAGIAAFGAALVAAWQFGDKVLGPWLADLYLKFLDIKDLIVIVAGAVKGTLVAAFQSAVNGIKSFVTNTLDSLWKKLNKIWDFFVDISSKIGDYNPLKGAGEAIGSKIGDVLYRAEGGPVSSGSPYIVGERGPELFVPRYSGTIVPNHEMGGGGSVIHQHFSGNMDMAVVAALKNMKPTFVKWAVEGVKENALRTV